ncbi:DUF4097 family beta strand repeat-containing protein [Niabella sp. 22666]|uniref:DUF4097 family beta strand repeat-containing protein n=1 Tax=Niabella sp. 22666 TaxID=3453954 RepID=UPI003F842721
MANRPIVPNLSVVTLLNLKVETSGGAIQVKGGQSSGLLEMYVTSNNWSDRKSQSEIQQILNEYYDVDIRSQGGTLTATAKRKNIKWSNKTSLNISFIIYSSSQVDADVRTSGGSLNLQDIAGTVTGRTSGGSITVKNLSKNIDLTTSGGQIKAEDLDGMVKLNTSGGSLSLLNLSGTVSARTSGGSISATNINGDFNTETSGGSIHLKEIDGNLDARTSGGQITADLKATHDFVKLRTSGGSIRLKMPETKNAQLDLKGDKVRISELRNFNGTVKKDRVKGSLGSGNLLVEASTSGGSVEVKM